MNLQATIEAIRNTADAPLSAVTVAVVRDGTIVEQASTGFRAIAADGTESPVNDDTKYRVASISKTVVAVAIMQLVERGLLNLDADVSDYLGFTLRNPAFPDAIITARTCLAHTSTLRDGSIYSIPLPYTMRDFFVRDGAFYKDGEHFADIAPPSEFFAYCNLNYGVLGALIEATSGERFDLYVQRHIIKPLGLDAGFNTQHISDSGFANIAALHRKFDGAKWDTDGAWFAQVDDYGGERPQAVVRVENPDTGATVASEGAFSLDDYVLGSNGTLFSPQGGLRISAPDLARYMRVFIDGGTVGDVRILAPESVDALLTPQWTYDPQRGNGDPYHGLMREWGLGLQHITGTIGAGDGDALTSAGNRGYWGHAGEAYGLLSGMWFNRADKNGIVFIIGGVGKNPDEYTGAYSSFTRWEERIMSAIL